LVPAAAFSFRDGVMSELSTENSAMISKLTTSQKAEVWVNLDQIVQMTTISVQDGYPSTEIIMANGAAINVYEKPVDIANLTKAR
jgi:ABC-type Zn2+ transport system substrate-binding protein/surface adhesin